MREPPSGVPRPVWCVVAAADDVEVGRGKAVEGGQRLDGAEGRPRCSGPVPGRRSRRSRPRPVRRGSCPRRSSTNPDRLNGSIE